MSGWDRRALSKYCRAWAMFAVIEFKLAGDEVGSCAQFWIALGLQCWPRHPSSTLPSLMILANEIAFIGQAIGGVKVGRSATFAVPPSCTGIPPASIVVDRRLREWRRCLRRPHIRSGCHFRGRDRRRMVRPFFRWIVSAEAQVRAERTAQRRG